VLEFRASVADGTMPVVRLDDERDAAMPDTTTTAPATGTADAAATTTTRWAILGPGGISRKFLAELAAGGGALAAVGSTSPDRARTLADEAAGLGHADVATGGYDDVLARDDIDAVYVSTVHTAHADLVLRSIAAGRAVLCEKPLAPNFGTVMALVDAAREAGTPLVEAYMYRFHPQTAALLELVRDGAIGDVVQIDATFSFATGGRGGRLYDTATAGGGILDVGGYPVSLANAVVGAATGAAAAEPVEVVARGTIGPTGVDEWTAANLTYADGTTATVRTGIALDDGSSAVITGTRGRIVLADPFTLGDAPTIEVRALGEPPRTIRFDGGRSYADEAAAVARAIAAGSVEAPEMTLAETLATARTLDRWRAAIELRYPFEAEDAAIPPVTGRAPARREDAIMPTGFVPGLDKPVSRLVMGVDNQPDLAQASAIFDHFVEQGGTAFDTAWLYADGELEQRFGRWVANRGIRDDVVITVKGAHTPHCDPESLTSQLHESLDRLGTDHADIYMMHRDNADFGVAEFVDVLDEHVRAGRIRTYGFSNWTPARFDEAVAYARAQGRVEPAVLSNHFGLAEALDVPWAGCEHVTDRASKAWLEERQVALLPWSSQARGFFTGRAHPDALDDRELVRCYYSDDNFERLRRAEQLGAELGVAATAIALAFVLHQPFPTFALFGPRSIAEARSSMGALRVELTPEQVAWLDLR
jgi:aryl-alcohol dehydrogenase-like predicted oxidoreductase/predicted dehydrogenase